MNLTTWQIDSHMAINQQLKRNNKKIYSHSFYSPPPSKEVPGKKKTKMSTAMKN